MKKQAFCKNTPKVGVVNSLCDKGSDNSSNIYSLIDKFDLKSKFKPFDSVKKRGYKVAELLVILLIMPFLRLRIDTLDKKERGRNLSQSKKDAYYELKNNEFINYRAILTLLVKQFIFFLKDEVVDPNNRPRAFIADDTAICKTGLKIEHVSKVHDHTTGGYIFGYKVLVLGYFDGKSFIPIDFSFHKEGGNAGKSEKKKLVKAEADLEAIKQTCSDKSLNIKALKDEIKDMEMLLKSNSKGNRNKIASKKSKAAKQAKQIKKIKQSIADQQQNIRNILQSIKENKKKRPLFGLTDEQREEQFRKKRTKGSFGYKRAQEVLSKKTDSLLKMIQRTSKLGIKVDYFIADSWFFSAKLIKGVVESKMKLNYLGMAPLRSNIKYEYEKQSWDCNDLKDVLKTHRCRRYSSQYKTVEVMLAGIPMQLFFVKMGRCKTWKLLATTDLCLNFIQVFELYQIRWSIEVFFKESKQYMGLGKCQSQDFDAQISSTTISMVTYILLCYHKRIHYQQKLDGLFEDIAYQSLEVSIVDQLIAQFIELLAIAAQIMGVDPIEMYLQLIQNPRACKMIEDLKIKEVKMSKKAA